MADSDSLTVWLDDTDGEVLSIGATFSIGRLDKNDLVLSDNNVSRRHAIIQQQSSNEYWLIDLGSRNGSYLNGQRMAAPRRLHDRDLIKIGDRSFTFRQPVEKRDTRISGLVPPPTSISITTKDCWLLLADITGSTALAARLPAAELATLTGNWMARCRSIVESNDGAINKYMGDGFLAYWVNDRSSPESILAALGQLTALRDDEDLPKFRLALHFGQVALGGSGAIGEESLTGLSVSFAFRMERLASELGCALLISDDARKALGSGPAFEDIGCHKLPKSGHEDDLRFFTIS